MPDSDRPASRPDADQHARRRIENLKAISFGIECGRPATASCLCRSRAGSNAPDLAGGFHAVGSSITKKASLHYAVVTLLVEMRAAVRLEWPSGTLGASPTADEVQCLRQRLWDRRMLLNDLSTHLEESERMKRSACFLDAIEWHGLVVVVLVTSDSRWHAAQAQMPAE